MEDEEVEFLFLIMLHHTMGRHRQYWFRPILSFHVLSSQFLHTVNFKVTKTILYELLIIREIF